MDLVITFCIREPLQHEHNWLVCAVCLCLREDCSHCEVGDIALKAEATRLGGEGEDRGRGGGLLQGVECLLLSQAPDPLLGLAGEGVKGAGNIGKVTDELLIEVHKAKEGLDLLDLCWGQPLHNSADLCWVHGDMVFQDDQSKVFDLLLLELAFLWLEEQPPPSEGNKDLADNVLVLREDGGVDED